MMALQVMKLCFAIFACASGLWHNQMPAAAPAAGDNLAEELHDQADTSGSSFPSADEDKSGGVDIYEFGKYARALPEAPNKQSQQEQDVAYWKFDDDVTACFNAHVCSNGINGATGVCGPRWTDPGMPQVLDGVAFQQWQMALGLPPAAFAAAIKNSIHECGSAGQQSKWSGMLDPDGNGKVEVGVFNAATPYEDHHTSRDVLGCVRSNLNGAVVLLPPGACEAALKCVDTDGDGAASLAEVLHVASAECFMDNSCEVDKAQQCLEKLRDEWEVQVFFRDTDADTDGLVSKEEDIALKQKKCEARLQGYSDNVGRDCKAEMETEMTNFECADADHDGKLTKKEYAVQVAARKWLVPAPPEVDAYNECSSVENNWRQTDKNKDGKIDLEEFNVGGGAPFGCGAPTYTDECKKKGLKCVDKDGDGAIGKEEFKKYVNFRPPFIMQGMNFFEPNFPPPPGAPAKTPEEQCLERLFYKYGVLGFAKSADADGSGGLSTSELVSASIVVDATEAHAAQHCAGVARDAAIAVEVISDIEGPSKASPGQTMIECVVTTKMGGGGSESDPSADAFNAMDTNGDGKISQQELFDKADDLPPGIIFDDVHKLMQSADTNSDGFITRDEFDSAGANHAGDGQHVLAQHRRKLRAQQRRIG